MSKQEDEFRGWSKSSSSTGGNGNCVEVGANAVDIAVRDTKDRAGGRLVFNRASWAAFIGAVRDQ